MNPDHLFSKTIVFKNVIVPLFLLHTFYLVLVVLSLRLKHFSIMKIYLPKDYEGIKIPAIFVCGGSTGQAFRAERPESVLYSSSALAERTHTDSAVSPFFLQTAGNSL